jgi:signal transduction histidine kinase
VRDSGAGIPAEHLDQVFDRFYRDDPSRASRAGHSGLGLAIVRALVEAHGGPVGVRSTIGLGTEFVATLPLASRTSAPGARSQPRRAGTA